MARATLPRAVGTGRSSLQTFHVTAGDADLGARPPAAGSLHRAGCEDGRAGQRQDPRSRPHHLQLLPVSLQRLQHRQENQLPAVIAQDNFRAALRMRHHAQHVAFGIDDPGNVIQ